MKKGNRPPVRRKPTKAEGKQRKKHFQQRQEMKKKLQKNSNWDELNDLHNKARAAFAIPAILPKVLRDENVLKEIGENLPKVQEMVGKIQEDVTQAKDNLNAIYQQHAGKTGGHDDPTIMFDLLQIGNQYMAWSDEFENKVVAGVRDVLSLANKDIAEVISEDQPQQTEG